MVAYAAEAQRSKPTHGGTASMLTLVATVGHPPKEHPTNHKFLVKNTPVV